MVARVLSTFSLFLSHAIESLNTRPTPLSLIDLRKTTPIQFYALLLAEGEGRNRRAIKSAVKLELLDTPRARRNELINYGELDDSPFPLPRGKGDVDTTRDRDIKIDG